MQLPKGGSYRLPIVVASLCIAGCFVQVLAAPAVIPDERALNVFEDAGHWIVDAASLPHGSAIPQGPLAKLQSALGLSGGYMTRTGKGITIHNKGSTPRLLSFGSRDKIFFLRPHTSETFRDMTPQQVKRLTWYRVPSSRKIEYNE